MKRWLCVSLAAFAILSAVADPLTGRVEQRFVATPDPMFMPTSVSVSPSGMLAVADGVNRRVVLFTADGQPLRVIGPSSALPLDTPLSVRFTTDEQLWIVDNAGAHLYVVDVVGKPLRSIALKTSITDVVPTSGGHWAVTNHNHQIVRFNNEGELLQTVGERGSALGQFDSPYRAAAFSDGRIAVTDTINGRIAVITVDGTVERSIGRYGVQLGELYRPKGIAIDSRNRVWVSDSVLGVVQCYTAAGEFVGVVRDANGAALRFSTPQGLACDAQDRLYVVEMTAQRVVRVVIETSETAEKPPQPPHRINDQPRHCTACHIEWMEPLVSGLATELADVPDNPPELPHVSRGEVCLSCHDGSVATDARDVWSKNGHQTGIAIPAGMNIAAHLPLADNKLVCRTCHSAHTRGGSGNVLEDAVFLRTEGPVTTLCTQCHAYNNAQTHPGHPVGSMSIAMPAALAHAGTFESAPATITCLTCHVAHGGADEGLLTLPGSDNSLCLSCHAELAPNLFGAEHLSKHGQLPRLNTDQLEIADGFETRIGHEDQLICLTCHRPHDSPRSALLAFDAGSDACSACHASQRNVSQSPHDLHDSLGDLVNRFGTKISEHGACAACHGAHGPAFSPVPTQADKQGKCTSCHAPNGLVGASSLPAHNHPEAACVDCHNPHDNTQTHFLKAPAEQLCLSCHTDHTLNDASPHHFVSGNSAWPSESAATNGACLACHRPHGTQESGLWRVAPASDDPTGVCIACHAAVQPNADLALQHPKVPADHAYATDNTCTTCHEPHQGVGQALLIASSADNSTETCYRCHEAKANIEHIGHGQSYLAADGFTATGCQPCHVTHGASNAIGNRMEPLSWKTNSATQDVPMRNRECYACHTAGGQVPLPAVVSHPDAMMHNLTPPDNPAFLPLFNADGEIDSNGTIGCKTCHLTHGRARALPLPSRTTALDPRETRARAWHLREFRVGNVCTTCHGEDALRRFMYFHEPTLRSGSVETGR